MIKYESQNQLTLEGFETPFEMHLDPSNRWVVYAREIPWDNLVAVYCRKMSTKRGACAKNPRMMIGALFIKHIMKLSDRDTIDIIKENIYMQYFIGLSGYTYKKIFDPSLFVQIRKRLKVEEFNEFTFLLEDCERQRKEQAAKNAAKESNDTDSESRPRPGVDKRSYGMDLIKVRTTTTSESWIATCNFIANLMSFLDEVLFVLILNRLRFVFISLGGTIFRKETDMRLATKFTNVHRPDGKSSGMNTMSMAV